MNAQPQLLAREVLAAIDCATATEPLSARVPGFDLAQAYVCAAELRALRIARGETPIGRKIGFTNRDLWEQYRIDRPIWGYMYAHTAHPLDPAEVLPLAQFCEPQIEPEIVLRLLRAPEPGMDDDALLDCVEWIAHGFEVVQSIYPGWRFAVADTIAGCGMHGALRFGTPLAVTAENRAAILDALPQFTVTLSCGNQIVETGRGSNVLGGPLTALRHLVELLASDPINPPLAAGEIVTTGTLTRAYPVKAGQTWSTSMSGILLAGISIRFG